MATAILMGTMATRGTMKMIMKSAKSTSTSLTMAIRMVLEVLSTATRILTVGIRTNATIRPTTSAQHTEPVIPTTIQWLTDTATRAHHWTQRTISLTFRRHARLKPRATRFTTQATGTAATAAAMVTATGMAIATICTGCCVRMRSTSCQP